MELIGRMDEHGRIWLTVIVRGNRGEAEVEALVDTGFTQSLAIPVGLAAPLGLELTGSVSLELADGRELVFFTFAATVAIDTIEAPIDIIVTERGTPLIGTALLQTLDGHLSVRFDEGAVILSVPSA
jgi:clan AA aspartic protease